jgi:hypothetical protein
MQNNIKKQYWTPLDPIRGQIYLDTETPCVFSVSSNEATYTYFRPHGGAIGKWCNCKRWALKVFIGGVSLKDIVGLGLLFLFYSMAMR